MPHRAVAHALIVFALVLTTTEVAATPRRDEVRAERRQVAVELRDLLRTIEDVTAAIVAGEDEVERLRGRKRQLAEERTTLQREVNELVRAAVMYGGCRTPWPS